MSWAEAGVGAVATQSTVEPAYGPKGLALMSEGKKLQNEQSVGMGSNGRSAVSAGVAVSDD